MVVYVIQPCRYAGGYLMPHASIKLKPGVDSTTTPALNEGDLNESNLIRFMPDRSGIGLVQKLGGWTKFYARPIGSAVRALWAWLDINHAEPSLAVGAEGTGSLPGAGLVIISESGSARDITPQIIVSDVAVKVTTVAGSNTIIIKDPGSNIDNYDAVYIKTQISVGGLILSGLYQCYSISADTYNIYATNVLGNPQLAISSIVEGGVVPEFTSVAGSPIVSVTFPDHGQEVGSTFAILFTTTVSDITLFGNYTVISVISSSEFTISAENTAAANAGPVSMNSGEAHYFYYNGIGPTPKGTGYGIGGYGVGGYGTGIPPTTNNGTPITCKDWSIDNWGTTLIASPLEGPLDAAADPGGQNNGPIFSWDPSANPTIATVIPQAPPVNEGCFVAMPQRQIIAWGSTFNGVQDPLLVRWCEIEDYTQWIASATNQAGSYRIPKGSAIIGGIQGPQQGLLWTDLSIWAMQYIGYPLVYSFNEIGTGCGLMSRKAATSLNGIVYWMGKSQFFKLSGNGVEPIDCSVWDWVFQNLDTVNIAKIRVAPNSRFNEVSWYFPSKSGTGEVDLYVKYNTHLDCWDYGTLSRTAWINESVLGPPIGAGSNQIIYQHETSPDADGQVMNSSFQTGYIALSEGDRKMFVDQIWPDMRWGYYPNGPFTAQVKMTFYVADYPNGGPVYTYGPYTLSQQSSAEGTLPFVTPRFRGRLVSIKLESNDLGSFWRLGLIRYRYAADGKF